MQHTDAFFNQLIEHYVYKVASLTINSVEPAGQTALINLLTQLNRSPETVTPKVNPIQSEPSEWEQVLETPVNWQSVHQQRLLGVFRARRDRYQAYILRLEAVVTVTRQRWQQIQVSCLSEPHRSRLAVYYEQTLANYEQQLTQARTASSVFAI